MMRYRGLEKRKMFPKSAGVMVSRKDWNALKAFFLDIERVYVGSYGVPGKAKETWLDNLREESPQDAELYDAAAKAIRRKRP